MLLEIAIFIKFFPTEPAGVASRTPNQENELYLLMFESRRSHTTRVGLVLCKVCSVAVVPHLKLLWGSRPQKRPNLTHLT